MKNINVTFMSAEQCFYRCTVAVGNTVRPPKNPRRPGYLFDAWYVDRGCRVEYDFSQKVCADLVLYAGFFVDAAALTNRITQGVMRSVMTITNECYDTQTFLGIDTGIKTDFCSSQGSGFIFRIKNGNGYVITNLHVISKSHAHQKLSVTDYQGNVYPAEIYSNPKALRQPACAPEHDLAFLCFKSPSPNLTSITPAAENAVIGTDVISLGTPKNQANAITYGKVVDYVFDDFPDPILPHMTTARHMMQHTASITNGSSGGPVLNADLQVVGINMGAFTNSTIAAIPIEQLKEFLKTYVFNRH